MLGIKGLFQFYYLIKLVSHLATNIAFVRTFVGVETALFVFLQVSPPRKCLCKNKYRNIVSKKVSQI